MYQHGESKDIEQPVDDEISVSDLWIQEKNGAQALYDQNYYPNTIIKLHKILSKYTNYMDCGEIHFYLGKSFEALHKNGQAIDAYKIVIDQYKIQQCNNTEAENRYTESQHAIERLQE